jgi:hypothetical protein
MNIFREDFLVNFMSYLYEVHKLNAQCGVTSVRLFHFRTNGIDFDKIWQQYYPINLILAYMGPTQPLLYMITKITCTQKILTQKRGT